MKTPPSARPPPARPMPHPLLPVHRRVITKENVDTFGKTELNDTLKLHNHSTGRTKVDAVTKMLQLLQKSPFGSIYRETYVNPYPYPHPYPQQPQPRPSPPPRPPAIDEFGIPSFEHYVRALTADPLPGDDAHSGRAFEAAAVAVAPARPPAPAQHRESPHGPPIEAKICPLPPAAACTIRPDQAPPDRTAGPPPGGISKESVDSVSPTAFEPARGGENEPGGNNNSNNNGGNAEGRCGDDIGERSVEGGDEDGDGDGDCRFRFPLSVSVRKDPVCDSFGLYLEERNDPPSCSGDDDEVGGAGAAAHPGFYITEVTPWARDNGDVQVGDQILTVAGIDVKGWTFSEIIMAMRKGGVDKLELTVLRRGGDRVTATVAGGETKSNRAKNGSEEKEGVAPVDVIAGTKRMPDASQDIEVTAVKNTGIDQSKSNAMQGEQDNVGVEECSEFSSKDGQAEAMAPRLKARKSVKRGHVGKKSQSLHQKEIEVIEILDSPSSTSKLEATERSTMSDSSKSSSTGNSGKRPKILS